MLSVALLAGGSLAGLLELSGHERAMARRTFAGVIGRGTSLIREDRMRTIGANGDDITKKAMARLAELGD